MGRNRTAPASTTASRQRQALRAAQLDEINQDDRVADNDAGPGHEADHRGGGEERAEQGVRRQDADQESGITAMMTKGVW
jgi:hypothetical protein